MSFKKTIACFGATGGCVGTTLASALKAGHDCTALVRTPEKLRTLLLAHDVLPSALDEHLTVIQGDAKNPTDVAKALISPHDRSLLVDVIVSGVGGYPTFQWSITRPFPLTEPTICETILQALYTALSNLASSEQRVDKTREGKKPLYIAVTTAGCGRNRGIPWPICLPYHYFLGGPLADKKRLEALVFADNGQHFDNFVIMRPLLLTDAAPKGEAGLRLGWEWGVESETHTEKEPGPAIGYTVSRKDVGIWTFENAIVRGGWEGKCVYLTN